MLKTNLFLRFMIQELLTIQSSVNMFLGSKPRNYANLNLIVRFTIKELSKCENWCKLIWNNFKLVKNKIRKLSKSRRKVIRKSGQTHTSSPFKNRTKQKKIARKKMHKNEKKKPRKILNLQIIPHKTTQKFEKTIIMKKKKHATKCK